MNLDDPFYIGWQAKAPPRFARTARLAVIGLLLVALSLAVAFALAQRTIGLSFFEWGATKTVSGILQVDPYPHLLVPRPGSGSSQNFSAYPLVAPFKFGLDRDEIARLAGSAVTVRGTLIYREHQTMIETTPDDIQRLDPPAWKDFPLPAAVSLGRQTFTGEIVDSKCYYGVMNPGHLKPHRACAVRCISGGIPPVLLVRRENGPPLYLLLVSADGEPVNKQVLDLVAEPVEITGEVQRQGDVLMLRADPSGYRRL